MTDESKSLISEMRRERKVLEQDILTRIRAFELKWGISVEDIDVQLARYVTVEMRQAIESLRLVVTI